MFLGSELNSVSRVRQQGSDPSSVLTKAGRSSKDSLIRIKRRQAAIAEGFSDLETWMLNQAQQWENNLVQFQDHFGVGGKF